MERKHQPFGEIIESSLTIWRGQSWQWDHFPPFGSLVTIASTQTLLLGLVYDVKTGSSDPSREAYAFQKTEEELRQEQPQLFAFLKTTFSCIPLGFIENGTLWHQLPPQPPKIHAFVTNAPEELVRTYITTTDYIATIMQNSQLQPLQEEIILALARTQAHLNLMNQEQALAILEAYTLHGHHDYRSLKLFAQKLQQHVHAHNSPFTNTNAYDRL